MQICRAMFTQETATFDGRYYRVKDAINNPRPIRPDGIPIMKRNRGTERVRDLARGPGRLSAALRIDRRLDGIDLCEAGPLWLGSDGQAADEIGPISVAGKRCRSPGISRPRTRKARSSSGASTARS